ncbi:hypothetical protein JD969_02205 [Planctomycetota bacterium]|nr:hypothetical protein JD969_02205 [Planctomycetota bacterium]
MKQTTRITFIIILFFLAPTLNADEGHGGIDGKAVYVNVPEINTKLVPGVENEIIFRMEDEKGWPLDISAFEVVHTQPIHVVILDTNYKDYHHVHPTQIAEGEYRFDFTPSENCAYKMWIDVTPVGGKQIFIPVNLNSNKSCNGKIDYFINKKANVNDYEFTLQDDKPLKVGDDAMIDIVVKKDGKPVDSLEPVMGAYSHMIGFYDDFNTIAHAHPVGKEPTSKSQRGGPNLAFHLQPEKAGYLRLYVQIQIEGEDYYAPFGINVLK